VKRLLFVLLFTAALAGPGSAEKRVALVVGNSAYRSVARLDNPDNDAALMARTLKELGFVLRHCCATGYPPGFADRPWPGRIPGGSRGSD
jgi:hypothetical protein